MTFLITIIITNDLMKIDFIQNCFLKKNNFDLKLNMFDLCMSLQKIKSKSLNVGDFPLICESE